MRSAAASQDPMTPKEWEAASSAVLYATRCFIDGLRSAPCLKAWTIKNNDVDNSKQSDDMSLFAHLQSVGVVKQVQALQVLDQSTRQQFEDNDQSESNMSELESMLIDHYKEDDRQQILYQIIFPILKQLQQCYSALDEMEPTTPPTPTKNETNTKPSKSRRKNAAPPPLGMLSLNDYVNVACLLEFAVSISIIPVLEYPFLYQLQLNPYKINNNSKSNNGALIQLPKVATYTTTMGQKRIQALPKPLAGRISKTALLWGSTYAAKRHESLYNTISDFNASSLNKAQDTISRQQSFDVFSVHQAYTETTSLATSIGHLVLLDRFRPMLLPRHLSDIYLGLFTAERLRWILLGLEKNTPPNLKVELLSPLTIQGMKEVERTNSRNLQTLERALLFSSLQFTSSFISKLDSDEGLKLTRLIDHREAALACRTLLSNGAVMNNLEQASTNPSIPSWLRMRLGQFLTSLAQNNLASVVDVFVAYARGHGGNNDDNENGGNFMSDEIMTGAAARLARALCAKPAGAKAEQSSPFLEKLCDQFVDFLVDEGQQHLKQAKEAENYELVRSRSSVAMSLTLWATIQQLSMEIFLFAFVRKLSSGLFPDENCSHSGHDAVKSAAAIGALLSTSPSSLDQSTKKKLNAMLFPSPPMSGDASDSDQPSILSQILRLAAFFANDVGDTKSKLVVTLDNDKKCGDNSSFLDVAIMTIIQTLQVMTRLGVDGQTQRQSNVVANELLKAVASNALDRDGCSFQHFNSMQVAEPYSSCYAVKSSATAKSSDMLKAVETRAKLLVRRIVVPLTQTIEEMTHEVEDCDAWMRSVPSSLFRLVLKLHFSNFFQSDSNSKSIDVDEEGLRMASTAFLALLCEECSPGLLLGGDDDADDGVLKTLALILESGAALFGEDKVVLSQAEYCKELLSTTSIVLSLVVAILELGSERRSESGEIIFQSMMPSLRTLTCGEIGITELSSLTTELAEMASHAMALIATRKEDATQNDSLKTKATASNKSGIDLIVDHITEAECDLESNQPPIRARGVVTLRHIARSLADSGPNKTPQKSLIMEVDNVKTSDGSQEQLALLARTLARICLNALADSESYVYLASIHTLVAISDVCPSEIITMMGSAVSTGIFNVTVLTVDAKEIQVEMTLTQEQRIKAVEALIFVIRRRGDGIFLNGPSLLETMLFGQMDMSVNQSDTSQVVSQLMQIQTHDYFQRSKQDEDDVDFRSRLGTGGPVYLCEESGLLRSAAISLVCELVSTLHPAMIAKYCHALLRLALDALQLESSRPVRRSAALLAKELYACVMRDETADNGEEKESKSMMAIAMVCAGEDKLVHALGRCVAADDVDTDDSQTVKGKTRLVDPATQSRSKEALEMRAELQIIFEMAAILAKSIEREAQDPVVEVVRKALAESL